MKTAFSLLTGLLLAPLAAFAEARPNVLLIDGETELYDHDTDPEELHDVAAQNADLITDLTARLQKLPSFGSTP